MAKNKNYLSLTNPFDEPCAAYKSQTWTVSKTADSLGRSCKTESIDRSTTIIASPEHAENKSLYYATTYKLPDDVIGWTITFMNRTDERNDALILQEMVNGRRMTKHLTDQNILQDPRRVRGLYGWLKQKTDGLNTKTSSSAVLFISAEIFSPNYFNWLCINLKLAVPF